MDLAPPPKKQKIGGTKSGRPKAAKKVWEEGEPELNPKPFRSALKRFHRHTEEMSALWKAIYGLVKENILGLMQNPEVSWSSSYSDPSPGHATETSLELTDQAVRSDQRQLALQGQSGFRLAHRKEAMRMVRLSLKGDQI
jgi:hypothetical protein